VSSVSYPCVQFWGEVVLILYCIWVLAGEKRERILETARSLAVEQITECVNHYSLTLKVK